jgi:hypothetical protein
MTPNDTQRPDDGQNLDHATERLRHRANHVAESLYQSSAELLAAANRSADLGTTFPGTDVDSRRDLAIAHYHNALAIGAVTARILFDAGQLAGLTEGQDSAS